MSDIATESKLHRALARRELPPRPHPAQAVATFAWRAWRRSLSMLPYMAIDVIVFPVIFLLIFTYLFGGAISGTTGSYLQFLLPGMLVYTVTSMTVYIGIGIKTDIDRGVFNRFRTLPFWQPAAIVGAMSINLLQFGAALLVTVGFGMLLGFRPEGGIFGASLGMLLVLAYAFCMSWMFAFLGTIVKKVESISSMSYIVLYPLLFTSNVFVDTSTMPDWLGPIVGFNPISLTAAAARELMHGEPTFFTLAKALGVMAAALLVFAPMTFRAYGRRAR
jgi:ABC-2 type transport system permease protein